MLVPWSAASALDAHWQFCRHSKLPAQACIWVFRYRTGRICSRQFVSKSGKLCVTFEGGDVLRAQGLPAFPHFGDIIF